MAKQLYLYGGQATATLDLLGTAGTAVTKLRPSGWSWIQSSGDDEVSWETFNLITRATAIGTAYGDLYKIQTLISDARHYHAKKTYNPCWLYAQAEGGQLVRSLVYDGALEVIGQDKWGPLLNTDATTFANLAIGHAPVWERATAETATPGTVSVLGGVWRPTVSSGDLDGRIGKLKVYGDPAAVLDYEDIWIGIKTDYENHFVACWEAEYGSPRSVAGATAMANGTASNGSVIAVSFGGTATMTPRMAIEPNAIYSGSADDYLAFAGNYLVLGRLASSNNSSKYQIDLYQSLYVSNFTREVKQLIGQTIFEPAVTNFSLVELGNFQIPPFGLQSLDTSITSTSAYGAGFFCKYSNLVLSASRESGAGTLYIDCFILIPTTPIITVKKAGLEAQTMYIQASTEPTGESVVLTHSIPGLTEWGIGGNLSFPQGGSATIVVAAQDWIDSTDIHYSYLGGTTVLGLEVYPRYSFYRST